MFVVVHTESGFRPVGRRGGWRQLWNNAPLHLGCDKSGGHTFPASEREAKPIHQTSILEQLLAPGGNVLTGLPLYG